ncbi:hypothetical protein MG293_020410 [Ovis ammon polii]|uniref:Uncharacterized protein n=1 Tax=Ovis ammon polii TaxID=230172 RepID=A0AAD4TNE2_OVIAM|nr:hypothetical protein MG293_020410 [Ovis ammon polii]
MTNLKVTLVRPLMTNLKVTLVRPLMTNLKEQENLQSPVQEKQGEQVQSQDFQGIDREQDYSEGESHKASVPDTQDDVAVSRASLSSLVHGPERVGGEAASAANLLASFNDQSTVDHLVIYLRLLPSGDLQQNSKFLEHCIEHGWTIRELCQQEVEPAC